MFFGFGRNTRQPEVGSPNSLDVKRPNQRTADGLGVPQTTNSNCPRRRLQEATKLYITAAGPPANLYGPTAIESLDNMKHLLALLVALNAAQAADYQLKATPSTVAFGYY